VRPRQEERWRPREVGVSEGARCGTVFHQDFWHRGLGVLQGSARPCGACRRREVCRDLNPTVGLPGPKTRRFSLDSTAILGEGLVSAVGILTISRPKRTGISIGWACQGMRDRRTREGPCLHTPTSPKS